MLSRFTNYYHPKPIPFTIQPGVPLSSISYPDARNCEVKFEQLSNGNTIEGIQTKIIPNCGISFILENKLSTITEYFNQMSVLCNIPKKPQDSSILVYASILGDDFLSRYEQEPIFDTIILEK